MILTSQRRFNLSGKVELCRQLKGLGAHSDVFSGVYNLKKVAVKRLRLFAEDDPIKFVKRARREILIWSKLSHDNVLPFHGFMFGGNHISLVSPWMDYGDLSQYMIKHPQLDVIPMLAGTARGLVYLHKNDIVHSDIKAANILVSPSEEPLICDFGISRMLDKTNVVGAISDDEMEGTVRFMAPEIFYGAGHSKASDVWAFGMLVLELLSRKQPFDHLSSDIQVILAIMSGQLPSKPNIMRSFWLQKVWSLCGNGGDNACWDKEPGGRLSMACVLSYLDRCVDLRKMCNTNSDYELADFVSWTPAGVLSINTRVENRLVELLLTEHVHASADITAGTIQPTSLHVNPGQCLSSLDSTMEFPKVDALLNTLSESENS